MGPGETYSEVTTINGLGLEASYKGTRLPGHGLNIRAAAPQPGQFNITISLSEVPPAPRGMAAKGREAFIALARTFLTKVGA